MEIDGPLVEGISVTGEERCAGVDAHARYRKENHAVIVDGSGVKKPDKGIADDKNGADEENQRCDGAADHGIASVAVGIGFVGAVKTLLLQKPGRTDISGWDSSR